MTKSILFVGAMWLIGLGGFACNARAQTSHHGHGGDDGQRHHHPFHQEFYRHWKQPGTTESCCNARVVKNNVEEGDCEPATAEVRAGQWWVYVPQINEWVEIPDAKIIRERNPNIVDAHHCWTPARGTLCFVPPDTGG